MNNLFEGFDMVKPSSKGRKFGTTSGFKTTINSSGNNRRAINFYVYDDLMKKSGFYAGDRVNVAVKEREGKRSVIIQRHPDGLYCLSTPKKENRGKHKASVIKMTINESNNFLKKYEGMIVPISQTKHPELGAVILSE